MTIEALITIYKIVEREYQQTEIVYKEAKRKRNQWLEEQNDAGHYPSYDDYPENAYVVAQEKSYNEIRKAFEEFANKDWN